VDEVALQNLASAPVLTGAIPIAVFDSAMKQFNDAPAIALKFFDMFAEFDQVPCIKRILQHVVEHLEQNAPRAGETVECSFGMRLFGIHPSSEEFPTALVDALDLLSTAIGQPKHKVHMSEIAIRQILSLLLIEGAEDMDAAVQRVLQSRLRKCMRSLDEGSGGDGAVIVVLAKTLQQQGKKSHAQYLVQLAVMQWPGNERLQQLHSDLAT
jgi:U3 small nucleolar RNA-associated protein 6